VSDRALVLALEARLVNAWPAFEIELAEGWLLRFAEGYSKRANSATAVMPGARLDPALVDAMLASFDERAIAPCFRLVGIEDPACEQVLADKGLVPFDPSLGMVAPLDDTLAIDDAVTIRPAAKTAWIEGAAAAQAGERANADLLGRIVRRIRHPAAFATLVLDGDPAAWGLAVTERGFVGLYDIVVAPNLRGLGLGRRLVSSLMAWGRENGAELAYLQMRETNETAAALYRSLGFTVAYRYTQRVQPDLVTAATSQAAMDAPPG
jgi:ribosomal protein S18 acetylase RimI-like enzyme